MRSGSWMTWPGCAAMAARLSASVRSGTCRTVMRKPPCASPALVGGGATEGVTEGSGMRAGCGAGVATGVAAGADEVPRLAAVVSRGALTGCGGCGVGVAADCAPPAFGFRLFARAPLLPPVVRGRLSLPSPRIVSDGVLELLRAIRSEERRVGQECR